MSFKKSLSIAPLADLKYIPYPASYFLCKKRLKFKTICTFPLDFYSKTCFYTLINSHVAKRKIQPEAQMTVRAVHLQTYEVLFEGLDGEEIIRPLDASGENYILNFETDPSDNFVF